MVVHAGCEYLRQGEIKENNGVSLLYEIILCPESID